MGKLVPARSSFQGPVRWRGRVVNIKAWHGFEDAAVSADEVADKVEMLALLSLCALPA